VFFLVLDNRAADIVMRKEKRSKEGANKNPRIKSNIQMKIANSC